MSSEGRDKPMGLTFEPKPDNYDHDDALWDGRWIGYRGKDTGAIGVVRCGECRLENYVMAVTEGMCAWCGWEPDDGGVV